MRNDNGPKNPARAADELAHESLASCERAALEPTERVLGHSAKRVL